MNPAKRIKVEEDDDPFGVFEDSGSKSNVPAPAPKQVRPATDLKPSIKQKERLLNYSNSTKSRSNGSSKSSEEKFVRLGKANTKFCFEHKEEGKDKRNKKIIKVMSEKGSDLGFMVQDAVDVLFPLLRDGLIRVEANKIPDAIPERLANHSSLHQLRIAVTWYGLLSNQKLIQDQIGEGKLNFTGIAGFNHTSSQSSRGPSSSLVYLTGITGGGGGGGGGGHFGGSKLVTSVITDVSSMSTATMIDSYYDDKKTQRLALSDPHRCIKLEGKIFHNYQKQGLGWMTQREEKKFEITDTEGNPREDAMWRCHTSDSGKTVYINKLTKKEQTNAPVRPRGGLLMDDMGLGKTVQMICLIVNTAYEQVKRTLEPGQRPAPTLIVCPVSVIAAWEGQFKEWVHEGKISVYKHHGTHREKDHTKFNRLDVVITSYDIVRGEHQDYLTACRKDASLSKREKARKAKEKEVEKDSSEDSEDSLSSEEDTLEVQSESTFPLFQTEWQRVVLDEAHTIKNDTTKQAQACMALRAQRNWALTGTPLQNSVMDLYPLFRFVKEPLLNKEHFEGVTGGKGKNRRPKNEDYARAIKLVLSNIGLRRLKTSKDENGRPLVVMPEKSIRDVDVHLSDDELKIYREIQRNARDVSDRMKCAPNKKSMVLPIITRMRQVCDDVRLINSKYLCGSGVADDGKQTPSDILANLDGDAKCLNCEKRLEDQTTGAANCGHVLCGECLDEIKESDKRICPVCEAPMTRENGLVYDYETNASEQKALAEELPEHVKRCRAGLSSKLQAVLNLLHETRNQKTVIFSQWTTMLDLTRDALDSSGISWRRLDGKMNSEQRERSITDFKNPQKDIQVFLISIKAGGVGITLTDATQVFLLDPWWNPAIEDQAIDRVHRLGQTKKVTVYRFNAKTDRVDDPAPTGNEKEHHYKSIEWKVRNIVHQFKRELQQELVEGRREKAEESLYDQLIY